MRAVAAAFDTRKFGVFISYSRDDVNFADQPWACTLCWPCGCARCRWSRRSPRGRDTRRGDNVAGMSRHPDRV